MASRTLREAIFVRICGAGAQGFEPQLTDPESAVLPLDDTPMRSNSTLDGGALSNLPTTQVPATIGG